MFSLCKNNENLIDILIENNFYDQSFEFLKERKKPIFEKMNIEELDFELGDLENLKSLKRNFKRGIFDNNLDFSYLICLVFLFFIIY